MTYAAIVARVKTRPHPNADRLLLATVAGHQVIVGIETQDNELGVFFPTDGQLSQEFCDANDLCTRRDELGNVTKQGYFDDKRRVKAQKLRGERSDGFWVPLSFFAWNVGIASCAAFFKEGDIFTSLLVDGVEVPICNKYFTEKTAQARGQQIDRNPQNFPRHLETENIAYYSRNLKEGDLLTITRKLHGTSGRYGLVEVDFVFQLPWWQKLINKVYPVFVELERRWQYTLGSRNAIITPDYKGGWYGKEDFRRKSVEGISLKKGEILYYEIVGYTEDSRPIMSDHIVKDKTLQKLFGEKIQYSYGCQEGECRVFVYRITQQTTEGENIDLPWNQVVARCRELGLESVPSCWSEIYTGDENNLMLRLENTVNGESGKEARPEPLDPSHIMEGIVIRVDSDRGTEFYKMKSWVFKVFEGIIKDTSDYIDLEEVS